MIFFKKNKQIIVNGLPVCVKELDNTDYICLTDMVKGIENGSSLIEKWIRNKNTIEFLGVWETMYNPDFNSTEFGGIKNEAGTNRFVLSVKQWIEHTKSKGIVATAGRYGGTYAHKDIAFEFASWVSPQFKLYLIKEYQRLKEIENNQFGLEWDVRRLLSKTNYLIHTDAIQRYIVPVSQKWDKEMEYAEEADLINLAVFGMTAKEWRAQNKERAKKGENIRDSASINELNILSNTQSYNAQMIKDGLDKQTRYKKLQEMAKNQLTALNDENFMKALKKTSDDVYLIEKPKKQ